MATRPDNLRDLRGAGPVNPVDRRPDLSDALDAVCARWGVKNLTLAEYWHCDEALASRMRTGERPLPDARMNQLPDDLHDEVAAEYARMRGSLVGPAAAVAEAVIGLARVCGCLSLPDRASAMATATIDVPPQTTRRRA